MASTKPDPAINVEEEAEGGGSSVEGTILTPEGEATSLLVCYSPCPIDFFDRESSAAEYLESDDFNIWGFSNPKEDDEEEIVLGTRSGSDQQPGGSGGEGLRVTGIDSDSDYEDDVLLAVNNVVNYIDQAEGIMINSGDIDPSYYLYLASMDENHTDAILGQMFDNEIGIRGNPPAAKSVIEDLPFVVLTVEELNNVCAVCKDDMVVEEKVKRLPCMHFYHGECIVPWLGIRNTCPVCRFELPTDDLEYERHRRSHRSDISLFLTG
ncbi:unnamed protein product [Arabis nemorensis]|uniref:RING-type E3 ubiquitin transferase n=1 Tax=Arabis nemorensis TaxID=586526 RepID=A0A565B3F8_9BRAS|nr:unnamed protein product [Arabis nemorensis]